MKVWISRDKKLSPFSHAVDLSDDEPVMDCNMFTRTENFLTSLPVVVAESMAGKDISYGTCKEYELTLKEIRK